MLSQISYQFCILRKKNTIYLLVISKNSVDQYVFDCLVFISDTCYL